MNCLCNRDNLPLFFTLCVSLSWLFLWRSPVSSASSSYILSWMATFSWDPQDAGSFPFALETASFGSRTTSSASWHQAWHSCSGTRIYLQTNLPVWTLCYHPDKLWMHWNVFAELRGCSWSSDLYSSESRRQPVNCIPSLHCPWQSLLNSHSLHDALPACPVTYRKSSSVGSLLENWKNQFPSDLKVLLLLDIY